ncbi:MAG: hypothetical protein A3G43_14385 [Ignavibacteria bacterium RIFCSPLOWO2_12_FULL_56_21]|nr:MAG: hypothetical protein A3G43_14385 [Ignavibacteria bacterium RIFCSPLOWO2_12_FULL_56_21]
MHLHHLREIMRTLLLLLVSLAVLPGRVHAQRERLVLRTYGVNDGLPSQEVRSVVRDSLGLVWVGTATGLAVSSGDAFVNAERAFIITFPPSPISQVAVHAREGGLLVSGAQGTAVSVSFVRQDPYRKGYHWKSLFSEIPDNVLATWNFTSIFRTRMKEVLIGTKGHGVWTRVDTGKVMDAYSFMHAELRKVGEGLTVTAIVEDSSGTVWVGTNKGLFTYLDASLLQVPAHLSELRHSPIRTLTVARDGSLWISADGRGLFHVQAGIAVHPRKIAGIPGAAVTSISCSPNGDVWCATSSGGLVRLRNGKISVFTRSDGLPTNAFHCVHADDDGLVWAGSSEGLTKILPESYLLYSETDGLPRGAFFGVTKAPNGDLWFSGTGALVRMRGSAIRSWKTQSSIGNLPLLKPVVDSQGQVWMLSARGVVRFGGNTFTLFADSLIDELYASVCRLKFHPQGGIVLLTPTYLRRFRNGATTTILKGERLQDFVFDRAGNIWAYSFPAVWKVALNDSVTPLGDIGFPVNITTGHGDSVFVLNRLKGFQSQYELEHMDSVSARDMNDDKSIKTRGYVVDGMVTKSGRRIITTTIAVTEQLVGDDRLKFLASTENMAILSPLYERSDGSILLFTVTSKNLGFYHLDLNKGSLIKQPLLNSSIIREMRAGPLGIYRVGGSSLVKGLQLLTEDSSGVLWAATPVGIMSFPPSGLQYPVRAPVLWKIVANHAVFYSSSAADDFRYVTFRAAPLLEGQYDPVGYFEGQRLTLPSSMNNLSFVFADRSYRTETGVFFQYRLDGVDTSWSDPVSEMEARYYDVDQGTHRFRVRSMTPDGLISKEHWVDVKIIVPFWKATWFAALSIVTVLYGSGRLYARRIRQLREESDRSTLQAVRENELHMAKTLQAGMLPAACPQIRGFAFAAHSQPASEVGGDFYDFLQEENRVGIVLGDVSGHGITGAMIVGMARTSLRFASSQLDAPAQILSVANERLRQDISRNVFVAMFYGVLEPKKRMLRYICAGIPTPILVRNGRASYLPQTHGDRFPLGILSGVRYKEAKIPLRPNDLVIFYTDGIVEAMNHTKEEFGFERLLHSAEELASETTESVVRKLMDNVGRFTENAPQDDDISMVVLRVEKGGRS